MKFGQIENEWMDWFSISIYPVEELPQHLLHNWQQEQERLKVADKSQQKSRPQPERSKSHPR